jgi:3'-phosphoadenosine 5'-phosphosulfate sulfotransferase (PAPS reductase)/FAD synthetase
MNPYCIEGPALVSFSGGRTSAYMLHEIVKAWDGELPDDVHVCFANTGKEREETLRFVHECGSRWGVRVRWLERAAGGGFQEVGYNSAARKGEPFEALVAERKFAPNAVARFCTQELKIRVMRNFALSLGWGRWTNVVGLRHDEGWRVMKQIDRNEQGRERWISVMPLDKAKVTKPAVKGCWANQPFDLGLRDYEGNCDLCFLKSRQKKLAIIRENPGAADWWIEQEHRTGGRFVTEYSYADLLAEVTAQGHLFDGFVDDGEEHDVECGLTCAGEAA